MASSSSEVEAGFSAGSSSAARPVSERRLDQLAWLLEGQSMCTAVTIMNGKFCISANEFFCGEAGGSGTSARPNNKQLDYICKIMEYFKDVANKKIDVENNNEDRDQLMQEICKRQINTATFGRVNMPDKVLKAVISSDILLKEDFALAALGNLDTSLRNQKDLVYTALGFGMVIFRRIRKIENYIKGGIKGAGAHHVPGNHIPDDQFLAFQNFQYDDVTRKSPDSSVLMLEPGSGVHAEMQILDRIVDIVDLPTRQTDNLVMTIGASTGESALPRGKIYIGISKLCCLQCHCALDAANKVFADHKKDIILAFGGVHDGLFQEGWIEPKMFKQSLGKTRSESKIQKTGNKKSLQVQIYEEYKKLFEERNAATSFNQRHDASGSEASLNTDDKIRMYEEKIKQDLIVFKNRGEGASKTANMLVLGLALCDIDEFRSLFEDGFISAVSDGGVGTFNAILSKLKGISEQDLIEFIKNPLFVDQSVVGYFSNYEMQTIYAMASVSP